jgi:hypothetical protein
MIFKVKQLEENISFLIFLLVFMVLSFIHSIIKYKIKNKLEETQRRVEQSHSNSEAQVRSLTDPNEINIKYISKTFQETCQINVEQQRILPTTSHAQPSEVVVNPGNLHEWESKVFLENQKNTFIKSVLNYCVKYNSAVLIVGGLAESYLYGIRVICNIFSILLGFLYALLFIQPFMISLKDEVHTPYEYFQKRYRNKTYVRVVVCLISQFYYFTFLTLYLWGCEVNEYF